MNTDIKNEMNEENEKKSENREKVKIMMYANFGEFINKKRVEKKITLRKMADMLGVSAPFLTDVEKDRRNPFDMEKLTQLAKILNLSKEENAQMLDLAGKKRNAVAPDLPEYGTGLCQCSFEDGKGLGCRRRRMEPFCRGTKKAKGVRTYICIDLKLKERDLGHQC